MSLRIGLALLGLFVVGGGATARADSGMVIRGTHVPGMGDLKPGSLVEYRETTGGLLVRISGKEVRVFGGVAPMDPDFTPYRILVELMADAPLNSEQATVTMEGQVALAAAALRLFPRSGAREEITAQDVRLTYRLNNWRDEGKATAEEAIGKARRYLSEFPRGRHRDEFEWKIVLWQNEVYEMEGEPGIPLGQAEAYEKFLREHPTNAFAEEIRERTANCYRLGGDFLDYVSPAKGRGLGMQYRQKAEAIYSGLLESKDAARAARVRVALYNLKHERVAGSGVRMDW